ncbi:hypothetical protein OF83DRAFT_1166265 [Amylostereum chailletii]|nr:hypothetical protein OF83DRAFT_1166265 [Amylostereum chailletii]
MPLLSLVFHLHHLSRGGQNLSDRAHRLERSLRGKQSFSGSISNNQTAQSVASTKEKPVNTFKGLVIPEEPRPPEADECCMSGCAICVYDLHEESLDAYKSSVDSIRASLSAMNVPMTEWPSSIKDKTKAASPTPQKSVVLDAFEEMERALQLKRSQQAATGRTRS